MFEIEMTIDQNYASFRDTHTERIVVVDSFDNVEFEVFLLTSIESKSSEKIGTVIAHTTLSLVDQLITLVNRIIHN